MDDLVKNHGVIAQPLREPMVDALRAGTARILAEAVTKDPLTKKVHDSYMAYMEKFTKRSGYSEAVYHGKILKG
jgi:TRAP-type mannitol/chloroaromatic compound transport system substrate-binding protein